MTKLNDPNFRAFFELSPALCAILSPDPDFKVLAASNTYLRATLTVREEIMGKKFFDVFPENPDDLASNSTNNVKASLLRVLKSRTTDRFDIQKYDVPRPAHLGGGYEVKYWSPVHIPILDADGRLEAILHHVEDVTDVMNLKQHGIEQDKLIHGFNEARKSIENERSNLRNLFRQTPELFCITKGPHHLFEIVNEAHIKILGFDATGMTVREAQPESVEVHGVLDEVYHTGKTVEFFEIPVTLIDKIRYFNLTYAARRDEEGLINGVLILGAEVTEQVLAREKLRSSQEKLEKAIKARDELLSICSHELRTPVASMKLSTQIFQLGLKTSNADLTSLDKVEQMVDLTDRQLDKLTRLIEEMLDFSRISGGRLQINHDTFDLSELVSETLERLRNQFDVTGSEVSFEKCKDVVGSWDRFRIEQVITNLLSNTLKYGEGRPVVLSLKRDDLFAYLSVRDQGIGISPQDQSRIFEPYERAVSLNNISGLGLGLYISHQIVEAHGGKIEVESSPGIGSTFTVVLPLHQESKL